MEENILKIKKKESHCITLAGLISSLDVRDIKLILLIRGGKAAR